MSTSEQVLAALAAYDLKQETENRYRLNSPLRPGSNSQGFMLWINGPEHGGYEDKVNGDTGSLYDLAESIGIELPSRVQVEDTNG